MINVIRCVKVKEEKVPVMLKSVRIISERVDEEEGVHEGKEYF